MSPPLSSSNPAAGIGGTHDVPADRRERIWAGTMIAALTAAAGFSLRELPGLAVLSPMIIAVVIGIAYANVVGTPAHAKSGIVFCQKTLLRTAIVLLGFQLTLNQLSSIGTAGLAIIVSVLLATFLLTAGLGAVLRVDRNLAYLIAAGTSVCGASAIVAANAVLRAKQEEVAYSVACITLFGTIAMLVMPLLAPMFGLNQHEFGVWAGASIHEVAQVVGAAMQGGQEAGEIGTVAKLTRVVMLAPLILALSYFAAGRAASRSAARVPVPWFAVWFMVAVVLNSILPIPSEIRAMLALATTVLLSVGLAALGLQTNVAAIRQKGLKPLILALLSFLFIASTSLALIKFAG